MIAAYKKNHTQRIPANIKLHIALQAMKRTQPVTEIAEQHNCSRTTVYKQQEKAITAANHAFQQEEDGILFYLPVTKAFMQQMVLALFLICKSSYRDILE